MSPGQSPAGSRTGASAGLGQPQVQTFTLQFTRFLSDSPAASQCPCNLVSPPGLLAVRSVTISQALDVGNNIKWPPSLGFLTAVVWEVVSETPGKSKHVASSAVPWLPQHTSSQGDGLLCQTGFALGTSLFNCPDCFPGFHTGSQRASSEQFSGDTGGTDWTWTLLLAS